jgi:alcohol dehydrogenase class IV
VVSKSCHPTLRSFTFNSPTQTLFGLNSLEKLNDELKVFNFKKAMLITGSSVHNTPRKATRQELIGLYNTMLEGY